MKSRSELVRIMRVTIVRYTNDIAPEISAIYKIEGEMANKDIKGAPIMSRARNARVPGKIGL